MRMLRGKAAEAYVCALQRRGSRLQQVEPGVRRIVEDVRRNGDQALRKYASQFDQLRPRETLRVDEREITRAWKRASSVFRSALRTAGQNIRHFCEWQKPTSWTRMQRRISLGQVVRPLDSVGCYVPGGRFPLVSTLLMTVIPAQVAGVKRICVASPRPSADLLAAAGMLGIREFYRVGGAQAVAAFAYGTETVPRADKIVGPGNIYVTAAKKMVAFDCSIDMLAGPTEALVVSDIGDPKFIAADLLAQAEHDPEALPLFVTTSAPLAQAVQQEVCPLASAKPSDGAALAQAAIAMHGAILLAASRQQAFDWANRIAPEHVTVDRRDDIDLVRNAGSIFIGDYSAQAAGDYASGPNHVLPTGGAARFRGGLSVLDFVKVITVQEHSLKSLRRIAPSVMRLAAVEGLQAHAESVRVRCAHA